MARPLRKELFLRLPLLIVNTILLCTRIAIYSYCNNILLLFLCAHFQRVNEGDRMRSRSNSCVRLDYYYRMVFETILQYQGYEIKYKQTNKLGRWSIILGDMDPKLKKGWPKILQFTIQEMMKILYIFNFVWKKIVQCSRIGGLKGRDP